MTITEQVRARVRVIAKDKCGYCRVPAQYIYAPMEIDHIIPQSKGGTDDESNLWLACPRCNGFKQAQSHGLDPITTRLVPLFNPRNQNWNRHFEMSSDGTIVGKTARGRATIIALQLNFPLSVMQRQFLIGAGWNAP